MNEMNRIAEKINRHEFELSGMVKDRGRIQKSLETKAMIIARNHFHAYSTGIPSHPFIAVHEYCILKQRLNNLKNCVDQLACQYVELNSNNSDTCILDTVQNCHRIKTREFMKCVSEITGLEKTIEPSMLSSIGLLFTQKFALEERLETTNKQIRDLENDLVTLKKEYKNSMENLELISENIHRLVSPRES